LALVALLICCGATALAGEQDPTGTPPNPIDQLGDWFGPDRVSGTLRTLLLMSALSLAPALLLMTTCFVRISIVLALLRQAIGTQGVPSNQVLAGLALFMTAAIMTPVWNDIHRDALVPYQSQQASWSEALENAKTPLHRFMARQIERTGNAGDVWLFLERSGQDTEAITTYDQVPFQVLAPAFLLSELKTAFLIGFQIYLPFLVIDLVVASVIAGMGLVTVPPVLVSLPAKLLLFVLVDGWHLIVGMLLDSFA
jgi:flagellar biosynthetic protein FliP